jgi:hypothetical protein
MLGGWHDYWESCGCEALEREAVWPRPLDSRHVSALLLLQWGKASGAVGTSPLDEWPEILARVANGVRGEGEEKIGEYVKLLEGLEGVSIRQVSIRFLSFAERMAIVKWARVEEYLEKRAVERRGKRERAKKRRRVYEKRVERIAGGYRKDRSGQVLLSVEELEERAKKEEVKGDRMARMRAGRWWNQAEIRRREIEMVKRRNGEIKVVEEAKTESGPERPLVELEIIRVGPNPRILVCRYKILAEEMLVKLKVKNTDKFTRGMRIKMREQEGEEWEYRGTLPTRKGVW